MYKDFGSLVTVTTPWNLVEEIGLGAALRCAVPCSVFLSLGCLGKLSLVVPARLRLLRNLSLEVRTKLESMDIARGLSAPLKGFK